MKTHVMWDLSRRKKNTPRKYPCKTEQFLKITDCKQLIIEGQTQKKNKEAAYRVDFIFTLMNFLHFPKILTFRHLVTQLNEFRKLKCRINHSRQYNFMILLVFLAAVIRSNLRVVHTTAYRNLHTAADVTLIRYASTRPRFHNRNSSRHFLVEHKMYILTMADDFK